MGTHKDLDVWKKSLDLVDLVYDSTASFPKEELYGLASQMRRASVSIPSNIAEGCGRNNKGELNQFIGVARGSLAELETQTIIALRRQFVSNDTANALSNKIENVSRMLFRLQASLRNAA